MLSPYISCIYFPPPNSYLMALAVKICGSSERKSAERWIVSMTCLYGPLARFHLRDLSALLNIEIHRGKGHPLHISFGMKMNTLHNPWGRRMLICIVTICSSNWKWEGGAINPCCHGAADVKRAEHLIRNREGTFVSPSEKKPSSWRKTCGYFICCGCTATNWVLKPPGAALQITSSPRFPPPADKKQ